MRKNIVNLSWGRFLEVLSGTKGVDCSAKGPYKHKALNLLFSAPRLFLIDNWSLSQDITL